MAKTIQLSNCQECAIVDDADYEKLAHLRWYKAQSGYAGRMQKRDTQRRVQFMHHMIVARVPGKEIDHANGNRLDNRRSNLRLATRSQNNANRPMQVTGGASRYKGVCWRPHARAWKAYIKINKKQIHLGYYKVETEAALAYNRAAAELFGEYARPNEVEQ